jgi:hypothetical protein
VIPQSNRELSFPCLILAVGGQKVLSFVLGSVVMNAV